ncbi:MAG: 30S ribosomal protein S4, partial [Oscillospiraceae bacterium]|nr:30S ribosomal protein S4 [Oscillospiraceae bacterium]
HYTLNGHKANIPSILLKAGDVVAVTDKSRQNEKLKAVVEANSAHPVPSWIDFDAEKLTAKINQLPNREDIDLDVEEHLIVELYSK